MTICNKRSQYINCILMGPPGSGKNYRGNILQSKFKFIVISTGQLCREAVARGTPIGKQYEVLERTGQLCGDDLIEQLLTEELKRILEEQDKLPDFDRALGFCFDGTPRRGSQCQMLVNILKSLGMTLDFILLINASLDTCRSRILGRLIHIPSGRTYHEEKNPPKTPGIDDITGEPLTRRSDDCETALPVRFEAYNKSKDEILHEFSGYPLVQVDGNQDANESEENKFVRDVNECLERIRACR